MRAVITLEYIGENYAAYNRVKQAHMKAMRLPQNVREMLDMGVSRPWVARITGRDTRYGLARQFVRGQIDYSDANSVGSRGVYLYFTVEPGIYEVFQRQSWQHSRRWFCRVGTDGSKTEISREEVEACLNTDSA